MELRDESETIKIDIFVFLLRSRNMVFNLCNTRFWLSFRERLLSDRWCHFISTLCLHHTHHTECKFKAKFIAFWKLLKKKVTKWTMSRVEAVSRQGKLNLWQRRKGNLTDTLKSILGTLNCLKWIREISLEIRLNFRNLQHQFVTCAYKEEENSWGTIIHGSDWICEDLVLYINLYNLGHKIGWRWRHQTRRRGMKAISREGKKEREKKTW